MIREHPARPIVAPCAPDDLDAIAAIEKESFRTPWPRSVFREELDREWAHLRVLRPSPAEPVAAFANFWLVHDEIHILNIATHPAVRRRGFAAALLEDLIDFGHRRAVRYVTLEVRRSNEAAIALYKHHGFKSIGVRPQYYSDDREDALVMMLAIPPATLP